MAEPAAPPHPDGMMSVVELPFDLVEVKLTVPLIRPGTVAKAGVIERLSTSQLLSMRPLRRSSTR